MSHKVIFPPQDGVFFAILTLVHTLKSNNFFFQVVLSFQIDEVAIQYVGSNHAKNESNALLHMRDAGVQT